MKLTTEQRDIVNEDESCLVKACPGSGKTRTIVAKLLKVCEEARHSPRKVACITYTNAAVHEVSRRLQRMGGIPEGLCEINTIHTFCLVNILRPFAHLLEDSISHGFGILSHDSPELFEIGGDLFGSRINHQGFRELLLNIKRRDNSFFCPPDLDRDGAREFYEQITLRGLITFGDIVYFSEKLVAKFFFIRRSLASKFHRIVVDEFQDTTPEQANILKAVAGVNRTRLLAVGDENQSIFGFADARPDIFVDFAENAGFTVLEKTLTGNFRCSSKIVTVSHNICSHNPRMIAVGIDKDCSIEVERHHSDSAVSGILDHFIPAVAECQLQLGSCAVLATQWWVLRPLGRALASHGIPVVGPGARPYRRASEFTNVAEAAAECAVALSAEAQMRLDRAVSFCIHSTNRGNYLRASHWDRRKAVCLIRQEAKRLHSSDMPALEWISSLAQATGDILENLELVSAEGRKQILTTAQSMTMQIEENHQNEDVATFGIQELAVFSNPTDSLQLSTFHSAKGLEWDAVALVDLHEGRIPHPRGDIDESRRLLYVGCTRARKLLMLFTHSNRTPSRFLDLLD